MVPKHRNLAEADSACFRAVLFRMVPKHEPKEEVNEDGFRAVLFRMVSKLDLSY